MEDEGIYYSETSPMVYVSGYTSIGGIAIVLLCTLVTMIGAFLGWSHSGFVALCTEGLIVMTMIASIINYFSCEDWKASACKRWIMDDIEWPTAIIGHISIAMIIAGITMILAEASITGRIFLISGTVLFVPTAIRIVLIIIRMRSISKHMKG